MTEIKHRTWSERDDQKFKELAAQGYTGLQIAQYFGVSRSAACGRAARMGVKLGVQNGKARPQDKETVKSAPKIIKPPSIKHFKVPTFGKYGAMKSGDSQPVAPKEEFFKGTGISLFAAGHKHCRWPMEGRAADSNPKCCGRDMAKQGPYCVDHARMAYTVKRPREQVAA